MPLSAALRELARLHAVETSYDDLLGRRREAGEEALAAVLQALDAPLEEEGTERALLARRAELSARLVEPVVVAWEGEGTAPLRVAPGAEVECSLRLEDGGERGFRRRSEELAPLPPAPEGTALYGLPLGGLPPGYHRLEVRDGRRRQEARVVSAPRRAWEGEGGRLWGVFLPLYALHTTASWGVGDWSDLEALASWTAELGSGVVGTLPMLAAFLDERPFEPGPYAPASRLFWNELYLDPRALPELALSPAAQRFLASPELDAQLAASRSSERVDYERAIGLKRRVLEDLAHGFFARGDAQRAGLEEFVRRRPEAETYAAFRAVGDRRGEPWQEWPERLRDGTLAPADYDADDFRYHLWAQWAADRQMAALAAAARRRGPGLYLDLPLGAHPSGFDVWREPHLFAGGAAAGAPPDSFFTLGQDWGFPPGKPEAMREAGHAHFIACLRHHLAHAGILRLDHVMQLERLFWVPRGMPAAEGVYVRYPMEELLAVLCLESHRHRALVAGENLGTVSQETNAAMERHGLHGMYVLQYELAPGAPGLERTPPARSVASLNTHDMPPFKAFWEGLDVADRRELGLLDDAEAQAELARLDEVRRRVEEFVRNRRGGGAAPDYREVLRGLLEHLAAGPARLVLVNLEDLWEETRPQNVPGTGGERLNWRRKARRSFEQFSADPEVVSILRRLDELRQREG